MPKGQIIGILEELGMPYSVDFANANKDAHEYAVKKLVEKFSPKGKCTLLDYIEFYGEYFQSFDATAKEGT